MAELHCDLRGEQRLIANSKLLGKCASEIKTYADLVYGDNALPYHSIARWLLMFKEGRTNKKG
jgi:hypothetical protein